MFLVKLSATLTALGFLPSVWVLLQGGIKMRAKGKGTAESVPATTPILPLLPYALLTSSMSFFLFSFQVHEKTILLPLLPMNLLLSGAPTDSSIFAWGVLVNNVAVFR
jgi:alpha-1,3-glucosyltransferase